MIQELIIKVDTVKPLSKCGDHALIYDEQKKCYYPMSREELLRIQDQKIKELESKINCIYGKFSEYFTELKNNLDTDNEEFKKETNKKFDEFLKTYQETNNKLIEMVEGVVTK